MWPKLIDWSSLHIPSAELRVCIKFSFQIVLPTIHRRWVVMDNLGNPSGIPGGASLARKRQGSTRSFGTIKLSLMQETKSSLSCSLYR